MKSKLHKAKFVCWFVAVIMMFQSCTVYKSTPISLSEAAKTNKKVLVKTTTNTKLRLNKIEKKDSIYYGIKTIRGSETRLALKETDIVSIRPYDRASSTAASLVLIIIPVLIVIVIANTDFAPDFGGSGDGN